MDKKTAEAHALAVFFARGLFAASWNWHSAAPAGERPFAELASRASNVGAMRPYDPHKLFWR
ncbi:MAG: hypothetical protein RSC40_08325, partial [Clostridia bacterium]